MEKLLFRVIFFPLRLFILTKWESSQNCFNLCVLFVCFVCVFVLFSVLCLLQSMIYFNILTQIIISKLTEKVKQLCLFGYFKPKTTLG